MPALQVPLVVDVVKKMSPTCYDDTSDRLSYHVTVILFFFLTVLLSAKQYLGEPIHCLFNQELQPWKDYIHDLCFINNTYVINQYEYPENPEHRLKSSVFYYQWIPLVLLVQAGMFALPNWIWKSFLWQSGLNLKSIVKPIRSAELVTLDPVKRRQTVQAIANFINTSLEIQKDSGVLSCRLAPLVFCGKARGSYLTTVYMLVKLLYLINVCVQFAVLNMFLGGDYYSWGFEFVRDLYRGARLKQSHIFPLVTFCNVEMRRLGNTHTHVIQCVLPVNIVNEKAYLFIWFWLVFVGVVTAVNFVSWMYDVIRPNSGLNFISRLLRLNGTHPAATGDSSQIRRFVYWWLRADGVLIFRFLSSHVGDILAMDLVAVLYQFYTDKVGVNMIAGGSKDFPLYELDAPPAAGERHPLVSRQRQQQANKDYSHASTVSATPNDTSASASPVLPNKQYLSQPRNRQPSNKVAFMV